MKLYVKQKVFSFRDRFYIKDESGQDRYAVEGEIFSWGKKLHIYEAGGSEVAFIRQKVLSFLPRFFVEIGGKVVCEIVKEFTFFKHSYRIDGLNWRLSGNLWAHDYTLYENDRLVMTLSKEWISWGDSYALELSDARDELMCLCVVLAVDCAMALQQTSAGSSGS